MTKPAKGVQQTYLEGSADFRAFTGVDKSRRE
jgi:hypothetical protein